MTLNIELNALTVAHVSNEVQVQVCQSMVFGPSEGLPRQSGEHLWLWEQPLTASSHLSLQFRGVLTPRKKHKQLIKVKAAMLDEEINNLSGCPKWQVQNKKRGMVTLFRLEQNWWWQIIYELDWNISFLSSVSPFPTEQEIDFSK